jgi:hypothetical protein
LAADEVPVVPPSALDGGWTRSRLRMADAAARTRARLRDGAASFWLEWYRELRRHAGNERLPIDLRGRLRLSAQKALERSHRDAAAEPFPRLLLRAPIRVHMPADLVEHAGAAAARLGIRLDRPFVATDVRHRGDALHAALASLPADGYEVVALGQDPVLDAHLLLSCAFLICDNADAQCTAYVTNTPTLTVNATDAFASYPVRDDGVYLLKTAIDLDTGRGLAPRELVTEGYYRNLRNIGYRDNSSRQIRAAVAEMIEGLAGGWRESDAQRRFRAAAVEAGASLAPRFERVAAWAPVDGFIGDGRLARVQAEDGA